MLIPNPSSWLTPQFSSTSVERLVHFPCKNTKNNSNFVQIGQDFRKMSIQLALNTDKESIVCK